MAWYGTWCTHESAVKEWHEYCSVKMDLHVVLQQQEHQQETQQQQ